MARAGDVTLVNLLEAELEAQDSGGQAALHHAHVVLPGSRLGLGGARQRIGHHKGHARWQRHILRVQVLQRSHPLSAHILCTSPQACREILLRQIDRAGQACVGLLR